MKFTLLIGNLVGLALLVGMSFGRTFDRRDVLSTKQPYIEAILHTSTPTPTLTPTPVSLPKRINTESQKQKEDEIERIDNRI